MLPLRSNSFNKENIVPTNSNLPNKPNTKRTTQHKKDTTTLSLHTSIFQETEAGKLRELNKVKPIVNLSITCDKINTQALAKLLRSLTALKSCNFSVNWADPMQISQFSTFKWTRLTSLEFPKIQQISYETIAFLVKACPQLTHLKLAGCKFDFDQLYTVLASHPNLHLAVPLKEDSFVDMGSLDVFQTNFTPIFENADEEMDLPSSSSSPTTMDHDFCQDIFGSDDISEKMEDEMDSQPQEENVAASKPFLTSSTVAPMEIDSASPHDKAMVTGFFA